MNFIAALAPSPPGRVGEGLWGGLKECNFEKYLNYISE